MTLENDRYTYRVTWAEEDEEYVGLCAEFPSLSWLAEEPEAALRGIRQVVADEGLAAFRDDGLVKGDGFFEVWMHDGE